MSNKIKEIAERLLNNEPEEFNGSDFEELAYGYLKLYAALESAKTENKTLRHGIDDLEKAVDKLKDGLAQNMCGYCEQSMNDDKNPTYEQLIVALELEQKENARLSEQLESANAEILSQLKHFNDKLNAKDAEINNLLVMMDRLKEDDRAVVQNLKSENARLRAALEKISKYLSKEADIAREALSGEGKEG